MYLYFYSNFDSITKIFQQASWLLIEFGDRFLTLFMARFASGFAGGGCFVVIPLIVSEISDIQIRGTIGSLMVLILNMGSVLGYITCSYTDYYTVPWIGVGMTIVFIICYSFVPETPKYLMTLGDNDKALDSLKYFKGDSNLTHIDLELYGIEVSGETKGVNGMKCRDLAEPAAKKGLVIGVMLMNVCIFSGVFTMSNYYETIFREAGSSLSPADSSIFVSIVAFAGSYSATLTIEKIGRKFLTLGSSYGSAICLATMGFYSFLKDIDVDVSSINWLPLVSLSLLLFIACNGACSVPFVILSEIYPQNVRCPLITFCMTMNWLESFFIVLFFPYMLLYFKMHGTLWIFSGISIFLTTILIIILPETKGLSIESIVEKLAGKKCTENVVSDNQDKSYQF